MPKILSKEQIEQYHETGYISPIDVMSEDEAGEYKAKLEAAERDHPEHIPVSYTHLTLPTTPYV